MPIREGDLNILKQEVLLKEYERLVQLSSPFSLSLPEAELKQQNIHETKRRKSLLSNQKQTRIKDEMNKNEIRSLDLASETVTPSWLNSMPLKRYHFDLTKREFRDGNALRYG